MHALKSVKVKETYDAVRQGNGKFDRLILSVEESNPDELCLTAVGMHNSAGHFKVNRGTFLHIAHEEGLIRNTSIHVGLRAPVTNARYDLDHDHACGFAVIRARDIDRMGMSKIIDQLKQLVRNTNVYVSVDIDVLDPAYAPGTSPAEVEGRTTRELLTIIDGLGGIRIVGADVVEVSPAYDGPGEPTVLAAAEIAQSLIALMVDVPVQPDDQ